MATVIRKDQNRDWAATRAGTIGELLLRAGKLNDADVTRVLEAQRTMRLRFGETAIALGLVKEADVHRALARQFDHGIVEPDGAQLDIALFAARDPAGAPAEALRRLRSELSLRCFGEKPRPLAVFAPHAGDTASVLVANLAIAFAQAGQRTLLVDANLREPRQHGLFGLPAREGLTNLLVARVPFSDVLVSIPGLPALSVLPAGTPAPNPQELLCRPSFGSLVDVASVSFEVLLFDCPAALDFADAQVVTAHCGAALLVAQRDRTRLAEIDAIKALLAPTGAELVGAVLAQR